MKSVNLNTAATSGPGLTEEDKTYPDAPNGGGTAALPFDEDALTRAHAAGIIAADWTLFTHEQSLAIRQKYLPAVLAAVLREPGFGEWRS